MKALQRNNVVFFPLQHAINHRVSHTTRCGNINYLGDIICETLILETLFGMATIDFWWVVDDTCSA